MKTITGYFKVFGFAEDEEGNKDYAAMLINLKVSDNYDGKTDITNEFNIHTLAERLNCSPEDITPITQEEYERDYCCDEDEEVAEGMHK